MDWKNVESSNIKAMAHDGKKLLIKFHNGGQYSYDNVSVETFDEIVSAESVGSTFHRLVKSKPGEYPYERLN